jgi:hypothetical protein
VRPLLVAASWNQAVAEVWEQIAPGVPVSIVLGAGGEPAALPATEPAEVLRIVWLEVGTATPTPDDVLGVVQLSIFVPNRGFAAALERAGGLDKAIGFVDSDSRPRLEVFDHTVPGSPRVGWAFIAPDEPTWVAVIDPTPGVIHLARTFELSRAV